VFIIFSLEIFIYHVDLPQVDHGGGRARGRERAIEGSGKDFGKSIYQVARQPILCTIYTLLTAFINN
jgi:hypothetical protein